jgi:tellurite resistance protein TehA-like permease
VAEASALRVLGESPGAFSVVMATGILAVAAHALGLGPESWLLIALSVAAAVVLLAARAPRLAAQVARPERRPEVAFGLLTVVAGTAVIGTWVAEDAADGFAAALVIWVLSLIAWLGLVRAPAAALASARFADRARGEWFLAAVAPFSLAVLAATLARVQDVPPLLVAAIPLWVAGVLAYGLAAAALAQRLRRGPRDWALCTPDAWITMGGLAIATVATLSLRRAAIDCSFMTGSEGGLGTVARITWVAATLLLLPVAGAFAARLVRHRPVEDLPRAWAAIFPLGMYALASHELSTQWGARGLDRLAVIVFWIALAAWVAAAAGTAIATLTRLAPRPCQIRGPAGDLSGDDVPRPVQEDHRRAGRGPGDARAGARARAGSRTGP